MHFITLLLPLLVISGQNAHASNCQNSGGVANGECVKYYSGFGCNDNEKEGQYKPTCQGNCFQGSFNSLHVQGDGTYGTDCHAYSDSNCQNQIVDTGNQKIGGGKCVDAGGAQSMKCYYRC